MCGRPSYLRGKAGLRELLVWHNATDHTCGATTLCRLLAWMLRRVARFQQPLKWPGLPSCSCCVLTTTACRKGEWTEVEIPLSRFLLTWKGKVGGVAGAVCVMREMAAVPAQPWHCPAPICYITAPACGLSTAQRKNACYATEQLDVAQREESACAALALARQTTLSPCPKQVVEEMVEVSAKRSIGAVITSVAHF